MSAPSRRRSWLTDPITVIGVVISVALATLPFVTNSISSSVAVALGLVSITTTLQVQSLLEYKRGNEELLRRSEILSQIEEIGWLPESIQSIVDSCRVIDRRFPESAASEASHQLVDRVAGDLRNLERGHLDTAYDDTALIFAMTESCDRSMIATWIQGIDQTYWNSEEGVRYWGLQQAALGRGVGITRIFIYTTWEPYLETMAHEQAAAGVEVYRQDAANLPARLREDLIIWDATSAYRSGGNASGDITTNSFSVDPREIEIMRSMIDVVRWTSERLQGGTWLRPDG